MYTQGVLSLLSTKKKQFDVGNLTITESARRLVEAQDKRVSDFIDRHLHGDWGDITEQDKKSNDINLMVGNSVISMYRIGSEILQILTNGTKNFTFVFTQRDLE